MNPHDPWDDATVRAQLAAVVPDPPAATDRMAQLRERRGQVRRRRAAGVLLAACLAVGAAGFAVPMALGQHAGRSVPPPVDRTPTSTPTTTTPQLACPRSIRPEGDRHPSTLSLGATSARLCGGGWGGPDIAPLDLLTTGLDSLVRTVNAEPPGAQDCGGPPGPQYDLLLGYPDGTVRRVFLYFAGCGFMIVGGENRMDPHPTYFRFLDLVRQQRRTATPPTDVPEPRCMPQYAAFSPVAQPFDMVAARLCVTYADNGRTTSTTVPTDDLRTILDALRDGPKSPSEKTPPCSQTTPTWILSGITRWGDPVQFTAECNRPEVDDHWVQLDPQAQDVVDRLVAMAGVQVNDGSKATTAWWLAQAWIDDINARATINDSRTAGDIADVADSLWVRDPWLPDGGLDWSLQGATRTSASGWQEAWRVPARTPTGEAVFVIVRQTRDDPWRILSLTR